MRLARFLPVLGTLGLVLQIQAASAGVLHGPVVYPGNGHSYYLLTSDTWTSSELEAVSLGGHLATVDDAAEGSWIYSTFSTFGGVNRNLWIGLYDPDEVNNSTDRFARRTEFQWISGAPVNFTNWSPFEPNNPLSGDPNTVVERYVHYWNPTDIAAGTWNNYTDNAVLFDLPVHGVVEVPEPTGLLLVLFGCLTVPRRRSARAH